MQSSVAALSSGGLSNHCRVRCGRQRGVIETCAIQTLTPKTRSVSQFEFGPEVVDSHTPRLGIITKVEWQCTGQLLSGSIKLIASGAGRDGKGEIQSRETDRQREIQIDIETDIKRDRQTDRHTERQTDREKNR